MAVGLVLAAVLLAGPAAAADYVGTPPPDAGRVDAGGSGEGAVSGQSGRVAQVAHDSKDKSGSLALTGFLLLLLFLAALLAGTGYFVKRRADRPVT